MPKNLRCTSHYTKEKYLLAFLLGFGCLFFTVLPIMIGEKGYFIYYGDYNAQQIPFYNLANDAVRSGQTGWSWYTDLGSDFMTSYSFYLWGSPFFRLSTLLPRSWVTYSMPILLAMKHGMASLTAYAYIRRFVRSKNASLIGGLLYAFSGFQIYNIFFNHFQDVTAFFPLMLIAMEENINNRRKGWFAVTVAFMAIINYYFFTGQAVFLVFYYLFRMRCRDFDTSWRKFFGLAFEAIAGTMIAGFILLPSALSLLGNSRISDRLYGLNILLYGDQTTILRVIQTFFMPSDPTSYPNLFHSEYGKWASIGGYLPLFGMLGVITFMRENKKHWATRFTLFMIICAFIPALNCLFQAANGYYYARWFYMPILIMAMMTARTIDDESASIKPAAIFSGIMLAVLGVISLLPVEYKDGHIEFFDFADDFIYFLITLAVAVLSLIVAVYLFDLKKRGKSFRMPMLITTAVACVICIFTMTLYGANSVSAARKYISAAIEGEAYENVAEDNFFRVDISDDRDNYPMIWGVPSMRAFQSVVTTSIMDFYSAIGIQRDVASRAEISHYTLRGLFSVKYYYREKSDGMMFVHGVSDTAESDQAAFQIAINSALDENYTLDPELVNITEELPGFEYVGENESFEIYENSLYIPMGFAYDTYITQTEADQKTASSREKLLMKSLVLTRQQAKKYADILTEYDPAKHSGLTKDAYVSYCEEKLQNCSSSFTYDSHGFESKIELDKPQLVFFSVPYSEGWSAEVNGKAADVELVSYGFMAVRAEAGENDIVFRYKTPGLSTGIIISIAGALLLAVYVALSLIFRKKGGEHTRFYDYESTQKLGASQEYCRSFNIK